MSAIEGAPLLKASERLEAVRLQRGYRTAVSAANAIGVNPTTYLHHENGIRPLSRQAADVYGRFYRVAAGYLLYGETSVFIQNVPIMGSVGRGGLVTRVPSHGAAMTVRAPGESTKRLTAYTIDTDDLEPVYFRGDIIFFDSDVYAAVPELGRLDGRDCIVTTTDERELVRLIAVAQDGSVALGTASNRPELDVRLSFGARIEWVHRRD